MKGKKVKNESALIFIDGTICDDRHRINLYGTADFYNEENVMNDKPVTGSVKFVAELAQRYNIIYIGARPEDVHTITLKWLHTNGFPEGKVFLATEQSMRIKIAESSWRF